VLRARCARDTHPDVLFIQGWGSGQEQYLAWAREIAALGCICLTFEPRGVARDHPVITGANHGLSEKPWQQAYTLLDNWATEMVLGATEGGSASAAHIRLRPSPRRGSPQPA
jgi:hypothetical protein